MEETGEVADNAGDDVARYEQLRRQALDGDPSGWRQGLAVLERRGVAAWLRAWHGTTAGSPPAQHRPAMVGTVGGDELVGVLAAMALAAVDGR